MTEQEIQETLFTCVATTIGIKKELITLDSSLINDLGADSLDLLDLVFSLEQAFGIEITRGEIERRVRALLPDDEFEEQGVLTQKAKDALKRQLPEVDPGRFEGSLRASEIVTLLTVRAFLRIVTEKLEASDAA
ncbi:MAG TPA: acyl carrier protein [Bacteroidota bacterium]|nr:acyl carrier protein [Bacteroidota bacterium]